MESYVWHLAHGLDDRGIRVCVICEQVFGTPSSQIRIIQVSKAPARPRWKSMLAFREAVEQVIRETFKGIDVLIHSHERTLTHHVATFHGPPIRSKVTPNWFVRLNRRLNAWGRMEFDQVLGSNVQMVLPVSNQIKDQLSDLYPLIEKKLGYVAWPGVKKPTYLESCCSNGSNNIDGSKIVFVGSEWKRKGLDIAVRIVDEFRRSRPEGFSATLTVIGVDPREVPCHLRKLNWVEFKGWLDVVPWSEFDLLLHPARKEPFGMVVSEARASGVPVLISDNVGASDLNFSEVKTMRLSDPLEHWSLAIVDLVSQSTRIPETIWSWDHLVDLHIKDIYPKITAVYAS